MSLHIIIIESMNYIEIYIISISLLFINMIVKAKVLSHLKCVPFSYDLQGSRG